MYRLFRVLSICAVLTFALSGCAAALVGGAAGYMAGTMANNYSGGNDDAPVSDTQASKKKSKKKYLVLYYGGATDEQMPLVRQCEKEVSAKRARWGKPPVRVTRKIIDARTHTASFWDNFGIEPFDKRDARRAMSTCVAMKMHEME